MPNHPLDGRRVLLVGRFAALNRKETEKLVRAGGGKIADAPHPGVDLIVLGEGALLGTDWLQLAKRLDEPTREAFERGDLETMTETELWRTLGIGDSPDAQRPLYTDAMLAELTAVPLGAIGQWRRLGLLAPVRQVGRLCYYDLESVLAANRIKTFAAAGTGSEKLAEIVRRFEADFPEQKPVLPRLRLAGDGKTILLPRSGKLLDPKGQRFFELALDEEPEPETPPVAKPDELTARSMFPLPTSDAGPIPTPEETTHFEQQVGRRVVELCASAADFTRQGRRDEAIRCCRTALCVGGFDVGVSFQLAELFAASGELSAARERYYMVLEVEEDHLEARCGLGQVLAKLGETEDAAQVLRGALAVDPDYLAARLALGELLFQTGNWPEAEEHLRFFRHKAPSAARIDEVDRMLEAMR